MEIIRALAELGATQQPALLSKGAMLLKKLYDADVLSEDAVLQWAADTEADAESPHDRALLKAALPFVQWLRTAEEDDSDEEESESD